jgi:hypothetical protein
MAATAAITSRTTRTITGRTHTGHGIGMAGIGIEGWIVIGATIAIAVLIIVWPKPPDDPSPPSGPGQGVNVMIKRLWIAVLGLLALCCSAQKPLIAEKMVTGVACTKAVFKDPVTTGTTLLVAAGGAIYVCGFTAVGGAAASTFALEYGTQTTTPCDTGTPTKITPAWALPIGGIMIENSHQFRGLDVPAGNQLCVVQTGTGPTQLEVYYDQF